MTLNMTAPFRYLSVSQPLIYSGTDQVDLVFTTSFAWDHPQNETNGLGMGHGYLDDVILMSFGVVRSSQESILNSPLTLPTLNFSQMTEAHIWSESRSISVYIIGLA